MGLHDLGLGVKIELPDLLEEHRARNDAPCISHQILQQLVLAGLQIDLDIATLHPMGN